MKPRGKILDVLDVIAKLVAACAAVVAASIATTWQAKMSTTTLLSQREQAESNLRMTMFNSLIGPVIGPGKEGAEIPLEHEQLLVELLALNFDEHFEVKPLLLRVDRRIASERTDERSQEAAEARHSLRSIARRVAARQLALLMKEGNGSGRQKEGARIDQLMITDIPKDERERAAFQQRADSIERMRKVRASVPDAWQEAIHQVGGSTPFESVSPDKRYTLSVLAREADWDNESFELTVGVMANAEGQDDVSGGQKFALTWYDFPFIDNTLLADGNRFAVVLSAVDPQVPGALRTATLHVIWFPKNFFTPRERPTDYEKSLQSVGKNTDDR